MEQGLLGDLIAQFGYQMLAGKGPLGQNIGQAGLATMNYRQQQEQLARDRQRQALQDQMLGLQLQGAQRGQQEAEREDAFVQQLPNLMNRPVPGMAPTVENAGKLPSQEGPYERYMRLSQSAMAAGAKGNAAAYAKLAEQYKPQQKVVGNTLLEVNDGGVKELYRDPMAGMNSLLIPGADGKPMVNQQLLNAKQQIASAGKTQVTTNVMPEKEVFKNSLTLKKDFDDQPEVKAFKEVRGAWDQISGALQKPSAANDLAAATKFMKLLDPGSVVRESELMLAMQATGKLDQFMNYANRIRTGQKLTPDQRKDFYASGQMLFNAAKQRYDQTAQQYKGIADQYKLDSQFLPKDRPQAPQAQSIDDLLRKYGPQTP